eukprot:CAMPEP_0174851722 /NCGR_PEP_ID=MMETSP1114-20130205/23555_1 /TAXON_ID=312471 /ORGANISM="Neobodo designis, Strain CCAP 1951/1" /LENGTH=101 /DNA_ID=CAMNT_0016086277 /DNA_START=35 /DNA_END=337 /DNA_ORIENTATION=-
MPTVFIGLGPRGEITEQMLRDRIEQVCDATIRYRGACAYCDLPTHDDVTRVIKALNGVYIGNSKVVVKLADDGQNDAPRRDAIRQGHRGAGMDRDEDARRR